MKCKKYRVYNVLCQGCDIQKDIKCSLEFNFDEPIKYDYVKRRDMLNVSWNECPICGKSIGYHPKDNNFRCPRCSQRILWK